MPEVARPKYCQMYGRKRRARFEPMRRDDLKPEVIMLIGSVTEWRWIGRSNDDEPYPGQDRWEPQGKEWEYLWAPDEDLQDVET